MSGRNNGARVGDRCAGRREARGTAAGSKEREGVTHRGADRSGPSTKGCPPRCLHGKTF